jgi:hypothetical protein
MTQILTALTRDHVILASDRQLTFVYGDKKGQVAEDNECKLVSLWHLFGIGYSGPSRLDAKPTHEWIATTIATGQPRNIDDATQLLAERATVAVASLPNTLRRLTFVVGGWERFGDSVDLSPHACIISNSYDTLGNTLAHPTDRFSRQLLLLRPEATNSVLAIGEPLSLPRRTQLKRNLHRGYMRTAGPFHVMRLLVEEIENTHEHGHGTVARRILAFCIPRRSVELFMTTGAATMLGTRPIESCATFAYFELGYSRLRQFAPTVVTGKQAAVIDEILSDPATGGARQISWRMIAL